MKTLGIIAGGGELPIVTAREARERGVERIEAIGFPDQTSPELEPLADGFHWIHVGQLGKLIKIFRAAGVEKAVMVGRLDPRLVVRDVKLDLRMLSLAARVRDRRPATVLSAIAGELGKEGITLIDSTTFLSSCMVPRGLLTKRRPRRGTAKDIELGTRIAKAVSGLDIGQAVAVKRGAVVAVEAMEGTDEMIRRAGHLCGPGMVVVKVARPDQDMRFDVPVVGEATIEVLAGCGAAALGLEAGRTIMLHRERLLERAETAGIAVVGI